MVGFEWQLLAFVAAVMCLLAGSLAVWSGCRFWASRFVLVSSGFAAFSALVVVVADFMERFGSRGPSGGGGVDFEVLLIPALFCLPIALVAFVPGFLGLVSLYRASVRRSKELEVLVESLRNRVEGD